MLFFLFVFAPAVRGLPAASGIPLLNRGRRSLQIVSWLGIATLLVTGCLRFIFAGRAGGFTLGSAYSIVLGLKLLLFLAMVLHHTVQGLKYGPRIESLTAAAPKQCSQWPDALLAEWKRWFTLLKINGAIGPLIVLLALGLKGI